MVQIRLKQDNQEARLQLFDHTNSDGGSIWYKIFDNNHNLVTEGNLPVDTEFTSTFQGTENEMAILICEYLGLTII